MTPSRPRSIALLAYDGLTSLDLVGPMEAFAVANDLALRSESRPPYRLIVLGVGKDRVLTESGLVLAAHVRAATRARFDTLIVPGGAGLRAPETLPRVVRAVRDHARRARRVAAVCTGVYGLAATGLLDGRRVTTHWRFAADVAARFPRLAVDADALYVKDGKYFTSAGITAGIDLALALIEEDLGPRAALEVARELVVFLKRPGGQAQYSAPLRLQAASSDPLAELGPWIVDHLAEDLSIERLAARARLSPRQFTRRFSAVFGAPPASYVLALRVAEAQRLLLDANLAIERIADATGFRSADVLRRAFERRVGVGPREYRARFTPRSPRDRAFELE